MGGSDQVQCPDDVLRKIKGFIRALVVDLGYNNRLSVAVDRYRIYCSNSSGNCFCSSDLPHGVEILTLEKEGHACRLYILLRVLMIIQQLLQENKHGSKRDIYYIEPSVFTGTNTNEKQQIDPTKINTSAIKHLVLYKMDKVHPNSLVNSRFETLVRSSSC